MMKKNKHAFHCEHCNSECMIYKKGKSHRVLVCPHCGVLATNGKFKDILKTVGGITSIGSGTLGAMLPKKTQQGVTDVLKNVPYLGTAIEYGESQSESNVGVPRIDKKMSRIPKPKNEERLKLALYG